MGTSNSQQHPLVDSWSGIRPVAKGLLATSLATECFTIGDVLTTLREKMVIHLVADR